MSWRFLWAAFHPTCWWCIKSLASRSSTRSFQFIYTTTAHYISLVLYKSKNKQTNKQKQWVQSFPSQLILVNKQYSQVQFIISDVSKEIQQIAVFTPPGQQGPTILSAFCGVVVVQPLLGLDYDSWMCNGWMWAILNTYTSLVCLSTSGLQQIPSCKEEEGQIIKGS